MDRELGLKCRECGGILGNRNRKLEISTAPKNEVARTILFTGAYPKAKSIGSASDTKSLTADRQSVTASKITRLLHSSAHQFCEAMLPMQEGVASKGAVKVSTLLIGYDCVCS